MNENAGGEKTMRVLTDRDIFGNPYERSIAPPPYDDWESQGQHVTICQTPDGENLFEVWVAEERRFRGRLEL